MEHCAISRGSVETEDLVGRYASEDLKAAAAAGAAIGPHGLFAGHSIKGKADKQAVASAKERAFAMAAVAAAVVHQAIDAARHAVALAAAAKQAEEEAAATKQAAATDDGTTDDEEGEVDDMTCMEYLTTYKELHPRDVYLLMQFPVVRTPFTDTKRYKSLLSDPDATQDDFDRALEEHEEQQDSRVRFREWVRSEYEAKGYVHVSDEYIARRAATEEYSRKLIEKMGLDDSDSDDDDEEDGEAAAY